jgi:lipoteichoic acid synthase
MKELRWKYKMQKTKYTHLIAALKERRDLVINMTTIFTMVLFLKLLYFNNQISGGYLGGFHGFAALGPLLILVGISWLLKPKTSIYYLGTLNILLSFIIFSNVLFYRYFNDLISIPLITQASCVSGITSSMFELIHYSDLLLVVDFILFPIVNRYIAKRAYGDKVIRNKNWKAVALFAVGAIFMLTSFNQLIKSQPTILQSFYDRVYVAQNVGLLNYHAADIYTFVQQGLEEGDKLDTEKQQEIFEFFKLQKLDKDKSQLLFGAGKNKNLIVVQVEALQQFVINKSVNGKEITPNLNKLVASGIYFDNYYYQTAGGGTSDAEFTANVSMYPMKVGAAYIRKPGNYYYSLPQKVKEAGYSTVAMHGYKPGFWNRSVAYKNIGFDEFYNKNNMAENEVLGMGISDKDFLKQALEKLKRQKQPYYSFLITLSSHFPYDNDKSKYSSFDVGKYKDTLLGNYLEAIHYTDEALGEFIGELESNGILGNTVLAIYGDHHAIPKDNEMELAEFLGKDSLSSVEWQQLQKVPMIIKISDIESRTISTAGGGVDFMPTLLNIMGVDSSNQPNFGRDLINSQEGLVVLRNGSFVTNDKVYISNENVCYDIDTGNSIPLEDYTELRQEADKRLKYSDMILEFDLLDEIRDYLEKQIP